MREGQGFIQCDGCASPALQVIGSVVVIEHKHHGERHKTVIPISVLAEMIGGSPSPAPPSPLAAPAH
jgi:hypothetical protein